MEVSLKTLHRLLHLKALGVVPPGARILEFGAQNVRCKGAEPELAGFIKAFHCLPLEPECDAKTLDTIK